MDTIGHSRNPKVADNSFEGEALQLKLLANFSS